MRTEAAYLKAKRTNPALNPFGPRHEKCDLPVVDVIQAFAGIHCDDGVRIQAVSSLRGLPAVKEPGHCQRPPVVPDFLPVLRAICSTHAL